MALALDPQRQALSLQQGAGIAKPRLEQIRHHHVARREHHAHGGDSAQAEQSEERDLLMPVEAKEGESLADLVAQSERRILQYVLKQHNNNRTATAKALKLSRVGLYKKMKKHGLITQRDECQVKPR